MYFFAQKLFWEVQETEMRVWDVGSCLCDLLLWTERTGFSFRYIRWLIYLNCIVWHVLMYWWFCASTNAELRLCSPAEKPFWWKEDLHFCLTLLWTRCKNTRGWKTKIFLKWLFLTSSGDRQVVVVFRCSTGLTDFLEASTVQGASSSPRPRQENECEIFQSNLGFEICLTGMVGLWIYQSCGSVQLLRHEMGALFKVFRRVTPCKMGFTAFLPLQWGGTGDPAGGGCVGPSHELCGLFCWLQRWFQWQRAGERLAKPSEASWVEICRLWCNFQGVEGKECEPGTHGVSVSQKESPESRAATEQQCLGVPLTFSVAICLLGESCVLSSSWVPSRASPTSYDMHSHLIILKKNTPHIIPGHSGLVYFLLLVYYSLRYCSMESWSKQHVIIAWGVGNNSYKSSLAKGK